MTDRIELAIRELIGALREELVEAASRPGPERLLTVAEAAEAMSCGRTLVYDLMARGELRSIRAGRLRRIPASAIAELAAGAGPR